ncbi:endonuclease MutS2 [Haliovirga abyssi]|uniref:Endonuclease MutS2 n=1 Tax=Haliovirga abyssi TaxID=2996794 RepID=A0AAU9DCG7_9FUSO|nr:endonuclease MutS2 [Haliovirga abyssi]BDU51186.1 endonuclease MutS2 [Haliovirga abyssi]
MDNHDYRVLEFDKIRNIISGFVYTEEVQNRILNLEPLKDINEIKKSMKIIEDYMDLLRYDAGIELEGLKNIKNVIEKTELIGTYLSPEEFYYINENLKLFRRAKNKIESLKDKYRALYLFFKDVPIYKGIEELISKVVDENKEIKDDASLEIREIRRQKKSINDTINRKFDEIVNNPNNAKAIQEKIVTIRDGRCVIPIKADFKGQIKGIEHDRSSSGATIYIEPLSVVSLNNKIRELEVREREEIRKLLLRLTDTIRNNRDGIENLAENILEIDFLNSKAMYSIENDCKIPKYNDREYLKLIKARHPLLRKEESVPLTFEVGKKYNIMLITGPNTGGKTVTLKTAGLITIMALSGIPVPADEQSDIGMFNGVYADIGDEQSIEQSLSSFSSHLKNIKTITEKTTRNSLILLDELGSGTDPIEGAAFAMAVVDYIKSKNAKLIVTTHYSEVKAYGYNEEGIETASMEFDVETLSPTYKLLMGIPGKSNALIIAKKLGLKPDIIERAEKYISEEDKKVENMIRNIEEKSREIEAEKLKVEELKADFEKKTREYEEKLEEIEKEKNNTLKEAYDKADELLKNMQMKAKALVDKIQKEENIKQDAKETQKSLNMLRKSLVEDKEKTVKIIKKRNKHIDIKVGEDVFLTKLGQNAIVLKVMESKGEIQVQAGILKLMVSIDDVKKIEKKKKQKSRSKNYAFTKSRVRSEIDLRGETLDEAIIDLDNYLDKAMLNNYQEIYIIHGKGTGKLRIGIQKYIKTSRYIASFRDGNMNEGGLGVTVAELK